MEGYSGVERNEAVQEGLSQVRDQVTTHGDEQTRVGEHHAARSASSDRHAVAGDLPKTSVLALYGVIC